MQCPMLPLLLLPLLPHTLFFFVCAVIERARLNCLQTHSTETAIRRQCRSSRFSVCECGSECQNVCCVWRSPSCAYECVCECVYECECAKTTAIETKRANAFGVIFVSVLAIAKGGRIVNIRAADSCYGPIDGRLSCIALSYIVIVTTLVHGRCTLFTLRSYQHK